MRAFWEKHEETIARIIGFAVMMCVGFIFAHGIAEALYPETTPYAQLRNTLTVALAAFLSGMGILLLVSPFAIWAAWQEIHRVETNRLTYALFGRDWQALDSGNITLDAFAAAVRDKARAHLLLHGKLREQARGALQDDGISSRVLADGDAPAEVRGQLQDTHPVKECR